MENQICSQKRGIAPNGDPMNKPPWGSTLKIETGAKNKMPTPLAGGQEKSFAGGQITIDISSLQSLNSYVLWDI